MYYFAKPFDTNRDPNFPSALWDYQVYPEMLNTPFQTLLTLKEVGEI
jgi:hypothetical protein